MNRLLCLIIITLINYALILLFNPIILAVILAPLNLYMYNKMNMDILENTLHFFSEDGAIVRYTFIDKEQRNQFINENKIAELYEDDEN